MKKIIMLVAVLFVFSVGTVYADNYKPVTGSGELNLALGDLNIRATGDSEDFIASLSASYNVNAGDLRYYLSAGAHAGDLYMAARLSNMTEHSFDYVFKLHERNMEHGWGLTAKSLGIKPGSSEFHALKDTDGAMGHGGGHGKGQSKNKNKGKGHGKGYK